MATKAPNLHRHGASSGSTKTRERILQMAVDLFNAEGVAKVSTNRIAAELDISPGNLYYHFKTKAQIVERLFQRFEGDAERLLSVERELDGIDDLWLFLHLVFEKMFAYRFVYRDVDYLATEVPKVGVRTQQLTGRGIETVKVLCHQLVDAGEMRATNAEIGVLSFHMVFAASCWFTFARMLPAGARTDEGRAAYHVLSLVAPFLEPQPRLYLEYLRGKYVP